MADEKKMKSAFILSDFKDAGTGAQYTKGATVDIEEGSYLNYEAAGLVTDPAADAVKSAKAAPKAPAAPTA